MSHAFRGLKTAYSSLTSAGLCGHVSLQEHIPNDTLLGLTSVQPAARGYATESTSGVPALKSQLRELYKRIHPDRFHAFPPARDTNERSFKLLQEYLAAGLLPLLATACVKAHVTVHMHLPQSLLTGLFC